jgi:phospholipase C
LPRTSRVRHLVTTALVLVAVTLASQAGAQVPAFDHVVVIIMENHEFGDIIGNSDAPFINSLAANAGLGANYTSVTHPSLPNYMALTGGDVVFDDDCVYCRTDAVNLLDEIEASGRAWRAYMEDLPSFCGADDGGLYAARHNPFVHYSDISDDPARCLQIVPFSQWFDDLATGALPDFAWITPNLCSDMHDCDVATGDAWLANVVPDLLQSPAFGNGVLFLVWDEGSTDVGGGGQVPLIVASPWTTPGIQSVASENHYSLLRTIEDAWGLPPLGASADASSLGEYFASDPATAVTTPTP